VPINARLLLLTIEVLLAETTRTDWKLSLIVVNYVLTTGARQTDVGRLRLPPVGAGTVGSH